MNEGGKSLEEMQEWMLKDVADKKVERVRQLKERVAVAQKVSELQSDPRWEIYGRHVEAIRDNYRRKCDVAEAKLLKGKVLPQIEYASLICEYASNATGLEALTQALTIAKVLIENGEQAVEALKVENEG